jgi:hypothetical protein
MNREQLRHRWILLRVRHWIGPALCALPYLASIVWLLLRSQPWIATLMLAPVLLMVLMGAITLALARLEFNGSLRLPLLRRNTPPA